MAELEIVRIPALSDNYIWLVHDPESAETMVVDPAQAIVTAAHPGWTATDLQRNTGLARFLNPLLAMKPAQGALPTLRAATDPEARSGDYYGPAHFFEMLGPPVPAGQSAPAGRSRARPCGAARRPQDKYSERHRGRGPAPDHAELASANRTASACRGGKL